MQKAMANFFFGFLVGIVFTYFGLAYIMNTIVRHKVPVRMSSDSLSHSSGTGPKASKSFLTQLEEIKQFVRPRPVQFRDEGHHHDDDLEAKVLAERVQVLCWIMTSPQNLDIRAQHVKNTWGKRCNTLLFMSSVKNESFPTVGLNVSEGRQHLTAKTMLAFRFVYEHYFDKADWFMKADDDTYVIVENLRYFLSGENTEKPVYFGHHFKTIVKQGFFSGGAGYVISKEALRRFGEKGTNSSICRQDGGAEDVDFGECMQNLGVKVGNSTDILGRSRFHCFDPDRHLHGGYPKWYFQYDANGAGKGQESISDYAISFHYVPPQNMYTLQFNIYHLQPYGIRSRLQELNQKKTLKLQSRRT